jgi:hypothetical protein
VTALVLDEAENQVVQVAATRPVVTRLEVGLLGDGALTVAARDAPAPR